MILRRGLIQSLGLMTVAAFCVAVSDCRETPQAGRLVPTAAVVQSSPERVPGNHSRPEECRPLFSHRQLTKSSTITGLQWTVEHKCERPFLLIWTQPYCDIRNSIQLFLQGARFDRCRPYRLPPLWVEEIQRGVSVTFESQYDDCEKNFAVEFALAETYSEKDKETLLQISDTHTYGAQRPLLAKVTQPIVENVKTK